VLVISIGMCNNWFLLIKRYIAEKEIIMKSKIINRLESVGFRGECLNISYKVYWNSKEELKELI